MKGENGICCSPITSNVISLYPEEKVVGLTMVGGARGGARWHGADPVEQKHARRSSRRCTSAKKTFSSPSSSPHGATASPSVSEKAPGNSLLPHASEATPSLVSENPPPTRPPRRPPPWCSRSVRLPTHPARAPILPHSADAQRFLTIPDGFGCVPNAIAGDDDLRGQLGVDAERGLLPIAVRAAV